MKKKMKSYMPFERVFSVTCTFVKAYLMSKVSTINDQYSVDHLFNQRIKVFYLPLSR